MHEERESNDLEILAAAQRGDQSAVRALYDRYATFVFHWVARRVDRREDAEDLTADIMLRMVEALPTAKPTATFKAWLFGIGRHVLADFWRTTYRLPEAELIPELLGAPGDEPDPQDDGSLRAKAEEVIAQLPDQYRAVLEHRFFHLHTIAETATAMATSEGNVKVLQYRALKKAAELAARV